MISRIGVCAGAPAKDDQRARKVRGSQDSSAMNIIQDGLHYGQQARTMRARVSGARRQREVAAGPALRSWRGDGTARITGAPPARVGGHVQPAPHMAHSLPGVIPERGLCAARLGLLRERGALAWHRPEKGGTSTTSARPCLATSAEMPDGAGATATGDGHERACSLVSLLGPLGPLNPLSRAPLVSGTFLVALATNYGW